MDEPVRSERDDRFLRGPIGGAKTTRRRTRLRRLSLLFAFVGLAAAGIWTAIASGRAPELAVDRILVEGNERLSDGEILELVEIDESTSILTLDLEELKRKLLRSAWVRDVELKRVLPGTLTLEIVERTPVAVAILDELYLLAEDGTILDQLSPQFDTTRLLVAQGLRLGSGALSADRAALAGRTARALLDDDRLALAVSELDVSEGPRSIALRLRAPAVDLLVSEETLLERLVEALPLLEEVRERYPELEVVDLRFRDRMYLRLSQPNPGETSASADFVPGGAPF